MKPCRLDHLVVTSPDLEAGAAWVREALGVELQPGGKHPRMGTHNQLLRLGDTCYLEVISPDPEAPRPGRPRWFSLDNTDVGSLPRLSTWVARTLDIDGACSSSTEDLGVVEGMSRGELTWRITIPPDGQLRLEGALPSLIQWRAASHPASAMADTGCNLVQMVIRHPEWERVRAALGSLGFDGPVEIEGALDLSGPVLVARIDTPYGERTLPAG